MAILYFIYLICSLRTNLIMVFAITLIDITFIILAVAYFQIANGNPTKAAKLEHVSSFVLE